MMAGCARVPGGGGGPVPLRQLIAKWTVQGAINSSFFYFLAIDTDDDPNSGPVPVLVDPVGATNGWGVIDTTGDPPPVYVEMNSGTVFFFVNGVFVGVPFEARIETGNTIVIVLDLDQVTATAHNLDLNIILAQTLLPPSDPTEPREIDALDTYITIPIDQAGFFSGTANLGTATLPDVTLVSWDVEVRLQ